MWQTPNICQNYNNSGKVCTHSVTQMFQFDWNLLVLLSLFVVTNQYSAALNLYLQAGAVCSDFFTKAVPPDVYTDQVHHTGYNITPTFTLNTVSWVNPVVTHWLLFAGPEEDDQVLFNDELPHTGQRSIQLPTFLKNELHLQITSLSLCPDSESVSSADSLFPASVTH